MTLDVAYLSVKLKVLTDLPKTGAIAGFLVLLFFVAGAICFRLNADASAVGYYY